MLKLYSYRWLIAGRNCESEFESGFFDEGSFTEVQALWAQTVVCGRAKLCGIPMGVIAVETRTVEANKPADPANPDTGTCEIFYFLLIYIPYTI